MSSQGAQYHTVPVNVNGVVKNFYLPINTSSDTTGASSIATTLTRLPANRQTVRHTLQPTAPANAGVRVRLAPSAQKIIPRPPPLTRAPTSRSQVASTPQAFHLQTPPTKVSTTLSNLGSLPIGTKVYYLPPNVTAPPYNTTKLIGVPVSANNNVIRPQAPSLVLGGVSSSSQVKQQVMLPTSAITLQTAPSTKTHAPIKKTLPIVVSPAQVTTRKLAPSKVPIKSNNSAISQILDNRAQPLSKKAISLVSKMPTKVTNIPISQKQDSNNSAPIVLVPSHINKEQLMALARQLPTSITTTQLVSSGTRPGATIPVASSVSLKSLTTMGKPEPAKDERTTDPGVITIGNAESQLRIESVFSLQEGDGGVGQDDDDDEQFMVDEEMLKKMKVIEIMPDDCYDSLPPSIPTVIDKLNLSSDSATNEDFSNLFIKQEVKDSCVLLHNKSSMLKIPSDSDETMSCDNSHNLLANDLDSSRTLIQPKVECGTCRSNSFGETIESGTVAIDNVPDPINIVKTEPSEPLLTPRQNIRQGSSTGLKIPRCKRPVIIKPPLSDFRKDDRKYLFKYPYMKHSIVSLECLYLCGKICVKVNPRTIRLLKTKPLWLRGQKTTKLRKVARKESTERQVKPVKATPTSNSVPSAEKNSSSEAAYAKPKEKTVAEILAKSSSKLIPEGGVPILLQGSSTASTCMVYAKPANSNSSEKSKFLLVTAGNKTFIVPQATSRTLPGIAPSVRVSGAPAIRASIKGVAQQPAHEPSAKQIKTEAGLNMKQSSQNSMQRESGNSSVTSSPLLLTANGKAAIGYKRPSPEATERNDCTDTGPSEPKIPRETAQERIRRLKESIKKQNEDLARIKEEREESKKILRELEED